RTRRRQLPHSFPTRRSSDLAVRTQEICHAWHSSVDAVFAGEYQPARTINCRTETFSELRLRCRRAGRLHDQCHRRVWSKSDIRVDRKSTRLNSSHVKISYAV